MIYPLSKESVDVEIASVKFLPKQRADGNGIGLLESTKPLRLVSEKQKAILGTIICGLQKKFKNWWDGRTHFGFDLDGMQNSQKKGGFEKVKNRALCLRGL